MLLVVIGPLLWLFITSLKPESEMGNYPPTLLPQHPTLQNYSQAWSYYRFWRYLVNSLIVCTVTTLTTVAVGTAAGYALARSRLKHARAIMIAFLGIAVTPGIALIVPIYMLERDIGWLNSYEGLIVPYIAITIPLTVWILRNFFSRIAPEMEEQAYVDGATPLRTLWSVMVPQAAPAMFTAGVFVFNACYLEFLISLSINSAPTYRTVPVGIALFGTEYTVPYGPIFAASFIAIVPMIAIVMIFRKTLVSGLMAGAVKG
jgi:multiple sugar transport system permease protein